MDRPLSRTLPELEELERIIKKGGARLQVSTTLSAPSRETASLPVHVLALGTTDPDAPGVAFVAGVHGLERIGTSVVLAFLRALIHRLEWDDTLHSQLDRVRLVFVPLVNPGGMLRGTRANPAGIDLMRNAAVDSLGPVPPLVGGHRISAGLPWYRGRPGEPMQPESKALCDAIERELLARPFSIALDCHSGFGMRDRIWFPFAHRRAPFPHIAQLHALHEIFERSHGAHPYVVEPQSSQYLAHGDIWDHLVLHAGEARVFLPVTLEMGSWLWVKKNPRQVFSAAGLFNPVMVHREQRVLRRHLPLFEFLLRAAVSCDRWLPCGETELLEHRRKAVARWYGTRGGA